MKKGTRSKTSDSPRVLLVLLGARKRHDNSSQQCRRRQDKAYVPVLEQRRQYSIENVRWDGRENEKSSRTPHSLDLAWGPEGRQKTHHRHQRVVSSLVDRITSYQKQQKEGTRDSRVASQARVCMPTVSARRTDWTFESRDNVYTVRMCAVSHLSCTQVQSTRFRYRLLGASAGVTADRKKKNTPVFYRILRASAGVTADRENINTSVFLHDVGGVSRGHDRQEKYQHTSVFFSCTFLPSFLPSAVFKFKKKYIK